MTTTVEREHHQAQLRKALDDLCLEAVCTWHGQFSYADIVLTVRAGLRDLGYTQQDIDFAWHPVTVHIKTWVADGSVRVTRECHVQGNRPKLFEVAHAKT